MMTAVAEAATLAGCGTAQEPWSAMQDEARPLTSGLGPARRAVEAPRAAAIAGLAAAALYVGAISLLRDLPVFDSSDAEVAEWFASGADTAWMVGALFLLPFAGIAFLWFIAVVRDQIG